MKARRLFAVAALAWHIGMAGAQPIAQPIKLPAPTAAAIEQHPGVALPLQLALRDDTGQDVHLRDYFADKRPVLLVLGYYRCPQLCGLLMHGLLEALHDSGVARRDWRIVGVSIDPQDTPSTARARRELDLAYADFLLGAQRANAPLDLHLLTADAAATRQLARDAGFDYSPLRTDGSATPARFAHPAAVIVATPEGKVSRYLMGIRFDPRELKVALADAGGDRIGGITSRIALLCAHFDPKVGRYSGAVMNTLRVLGVSMALLLGAWCWRRRAPKEGSR